MFKPLAERLHGRLQALAKNQKQQTLLASVLEKFSIEAYGRASRELFEATYELHEKQVTIAARSKTTASDLLLRSGELAALFRQSGLGVARIVIR